MKATGSDHRASGPAGSGSPESGPGPGTALFKDLARAIAALAELQDLRSFSLPYPPDAQRALDRTVLRCQEIGRPPPRSLPELLEWCRHRTADDPLFEVPASLITPQATLIHPTGMMPTRTCLELTAWGPGGSEEAEARALLTGLEARCGSAEQYRQCLRFLARHPVVSQSDRGHRSEWSTTIWTRVKGLYGPLPDSLKIGGISLRCPGCGLPALPKDRKPLAQGAPRSGPHTWCEGEECPDGLSLELCRSPDQVRLLRRSLRLFLALPGLVEAVALKALDSAGVDYEALPEDLTAFRIKGSVDREIQVYDRVQPALLAARCVAAASPPSALTFVVVPDRRAESNAYRAMFTAALPEAFRDRLLLTGARELAGHVSSAPGPPTGRELRSTDDKGDSHA